MKPAIEIRNLGKEYTLKSGQSYVALRDVITNSFRNIFTRTKSDQKFFALKDINLDVMQGERIGIVGHNGAGKSTLLKIISRITPPTTGEAIIRGRVGSLLEVGTGFHPELTGRENIYLNGSILGLKKTEINKQLDAIIDFSGVEKFIDTPLKHYSSGMQLRIAFSVAAHLEPEILLIDEVLAVGDMEFQKKCLGKMEEVSKSHGRTILFVSHNLAAVKQLCTKGLLLEYGENKLYNDINTVLQTYSSSYLQKVNRTAIGSYDLGQHPNKIKPGSGLLSAKMFINNNLAEEFIPGSDFKITAGYYLTSPLVDPEVGIVIKDENYIPVIGLNNKHLGKKLELKVNEPGEVTISIPAFNIYMPGKYFVDLYLGDQVHYFECLYDAFTFTVLPHDVFNSGEELRPEWNKIFINNMDIS